METKGYLANHACQAVFSHTQDEAKQKVVYMVVQFSCLVVICHLAWSRAVGLDQSERSISAPSLAGARTSRLPVCRFAVRVLEVQVVLASILTAFQDGWQSSILRQTQIQGLPLPHVFQENDPLRSTEWISRCSRVAASAFCKILDVFFFRKSHSFSFFGLWVLLVKRGVANDPARDSLRAVDKRKALRVRITKNLTAAKPPRQEHLIQCRTHAFSMSKATHALATWGVQVA